MATSTECLTLFYHNPAQCLTQFDYRALNMDTTQHISTEEDQGGALTNKVMVIVFWDVRDVMHINYLQKGRTINGEYYCNS